MSQENAMAKTYIITGTGRGIGFELTRQLLESKNRVLALARQPQKSPGLMDLKESYKDLLETHKVDITSDTDIQAFTKSLPEPFKFDVLINNAGIYGDDEDLAKLDLSKVLKTIEVNALGPMRVTRALLPF
jgi:NAD(P)-dependent dehydrogenase (short-subunit alcohol dehydrogenase family)